MKRLTLCAAAVMAMALSGATASAERSATEPEPFLFVAPSPPLVAQVVVEGSPTGRCARLLRIPHADIVDLSPNGRLLANRHLCR